MGSIRLEHFYGVRLVLVSSREADRASIFIGSTDLGLFLRVSFIFVAVLLAGFVEHV